MKKNSCIPLGIDAGGKYLTCGERPFFWLGDTAWLLLQKLDFKNAKIYLKNRQEKGYNVIQTVLVHTIEAADPTKSSLASGVKDITEKEYWDFADSVLDFAESLGIYIALLPAWGSLVKEEILTEEKAEEYANFLGKHFKGRSNIIWVLGGDIRGDVHPEVFAKLGTVLKSYNPERLIAFHPFGRTASSLWFANEPWLDINMFQSGHRRYDQASLGVWDDNEQREEFFGEDNWKYVRRDHKTGLIKPTLDAEPSYEGIPQGLHNPHNPYWEEWDVRRYAYWSVFEGAAGHTYGSNAIMQFFDPAQDKEGAYGVRDSWQQAMHTPGAAQLKHLKELMESVDFTSGRPAEELLLYGQKERYHRIAVFAGESFIFCYDYSGDEFLLDLRLYKEKTMCAWWMDPRSGDLSFIDELKGEDSYFASPSNRAGSSNDWVLVLKELV